jgi:hypothetical protein
MCDYLLTIWNFLFETHDLRFLAFTVSWDMTPYSLPGINIISQEQAFIFMVKEWIVP